MYNIQGKFIFSEEEFTNSQILREAIDWQKYADDATGANKYADDATWANDYYNKKSGESSFENNITNTPIPTLNPITTKKEVTEKPSSTSYPTTSYPTNQNTSFRKKECNYQSCDGRCTKYKNDKAWCYVSDNSSCTDIKTGQGGDWSEKACENLPSNYKLEESINTTDNSSKNTTKKEKVKLDFKYVYLLWILASVYYFSCVIFYTSECIKYGIVDDINIDELTYLDHIRIPIGLSFATFILSILVLNMTNFDKYDKSDFGKRMNSLAKASQVGNNNINDEPDEGCNYTFKYRTQNKKHSYNGYDYCYLNPECAINENSKSYCSKQSTGKASNEYIKKTNRINNINRYISDDNDDEPDEGCNMMYKYRTQNIKHSYNGYGFCYSDPECAIDENSQFICNKEWTGKGSREYIKMTDRMNGFSVSIN